MNLQSLLFSCLVLLLLLGLPYLSAAAASVLTSGSGEADEEEQPKSQITVMGIVYCDICSNNSFSRHSYFLPGVQVKIDCKIKTNSPTTRELISFSAQRITNRFGIYKLEIPDLEGIKCAEDELSVVSSCNASLISSRAKSCNVPGYTTTSDQLVSFKSKQNNLCIYSLTALNFRPSKRDHNLCGH